MEFGLVISSQATIEAYKVASHFQDLKTPEEVIHISRSKIIFEGPENNPFFAASLGLNMSALQHLRGMIESHQSPGYYLMYPFIFHLTSGVAVTGLSTNR